MLTGSRGGSVPLCGRTAVEREWSRIDEHRSRLERAKSAGRVAGAGAFQSADGRFALGLAGDGATKWAQ